MRTAIRCLIVALLASPAFGGVDGGDVDPMPIGPYPAGAPNGVVVQGNPGDVQVAPAGSEGGGAPPVPNASGNILCLDTLSGTGSLLIEFTFACEELPRGSCRVKYDFSGATWAFGGGLEVYIDANGVYNNPSDIWGPPVGFPPSTVFGSQTFSAGECDASQHTIAFRVRPQTRIYIDNLVTECTPPLGVQGSTWGATKELFR
jgi:hypothetical protein